MNGHPAALPPPCKPTIRWWLPLLAAGLLSACSPRHLIVRELADNLAGQGMGQEEDLLLARDAAPLYLKLSESVLQQVPDHLALGESVASGLTQYAYAYVAWEADKLDATDSRAAHRLRQRAARLYQRAQRHAMATLEQAHPGFAKALAQPDPALWPRLKPGEVGLAYWAAASRGAFIALSKDDPNVVADLPLATRLARLAHAVAPGHADGALASLMGQFEAVRPGGSAQQAAAYFDNAIALAAGRSAGPWVAKAESWAQPAGDRVAFEALLRQALRAGAGQHDLANQVMRQRAQWLLDQADDLF